MFKVHDHKLPLLWLGVLRCSEAERIAKTPASARGVLDFHSATKYPGLADCALEPLGLMLQRYFRIVSRSPEDVEFYSNKILPLNLSTVNFIDALKDAELQQNEERREAHDTKRFQRRLAEAERNGMVYDDGVAGSIALGADDDSDRTRRRRQGRKRSDYIDVSDGDDDADGALPETKVPRSVSPVITEVE